MNRASGEFKRALLIASLTERKMASCGAKGGALSTPPMPGAEGRWLSQFRPISLSARDVTMTQISSRASSMAAAANGKKGGWRREALPMRVYSGDTEPSTTLGDTEEMRVDASASAPRARRQAARVVECVTVEGEAASASACSAARGSKKAARRGEADVTIRGRTCM